MKAPAFDYLRAESPQQVYALLAQHGVTDFNRYAMVPGTTNFIPDFFVD